MVNYDITERTVFGISAKKIASTYHDSGAKADCAIGGLPFQYAIKDDLPYSRETADYRRQQIDTSREPGEQSLSQWWVRDQTSWHRGAGIQFYEPGSDETTRYRFQESLGVNVWDKGYLSLMHRTNLRQGGSTSVDQFVKGAVVNGVNVLFTVVDGVMRRDDGTTTPTSYTSANLCGSQPAIAGSKVLVGSTAGILAGDPSGSSLTALWTSSSGALVTPWWAKSRIIAGRNNALYDLTLAGGNLDTATALYTHPSSTFVWTDVAEAGGAILASGRDQGYGYIFRFALESPGTAGVPSIGPGVQTASFPPGEEVYAIEVYLGSFIAIGTAKGVRIGQVDDTGAIAYGPLTIETTYPVRSLAARDRFVYAAVSFDLSGDSGVARIDLGEEILNYSSQGYPSQSQRYAWAYDVSSGQYASETINVTFLGTSDRVAFSLRGYGVFIEDPGAYVTNGYLTTGAIRYATAENKQFNLVKVRSSIPSTSSISVSTIDAQGNEQSAFTLGDSFNSDDDITLKAVSDKPQEKVSLTFTLNASTDRTQTPLMSSYQLKATPAPKVQRIVTLPLRLNDREQDRNGVKYGYPGSAWDRLKILEDLESNNRVIVFEDFTNGETFSGQIRSLKFIRLTPPEKSNDNFGGYLIVEMLMF